MTSRRRFLLAAGVTAVGVGAGAGAGIWVVQRGSARRSAPQARIELGEVLGRSAQGYARATGPRRFEFPRDYGPHPAFRSEWWYFTGNLFGGAARGSEGSGSAPAGGGRPFGFELTFFRFALAPPPPDETHPASQWTTRQAYMAHFALTDVAGGRFYQDERLSRGAVGLAGAQASPFRVWLYDWQALSTGAATFPIRLRARTREFGLDLVLHGGKPVVLQGDEGLSRKSAEPGNASYYYSRTRMPAAGWVRAGAARHGVGGLAWLDREWSTSALAADEVGWDWFALQLDDGWDLMYYRLRRRDGSTDPYSAGSLVAPDGSKTSLGSRDVRIEVLGHWTSPRSEARYPAGWRLRVGPRNLDLELSPKLADQEIDQSVRYWEGAVRVRGSAAGRAVAGNGYVELTGYGGMAGRK